MVEEKMIEQQNVRKKIKMTKKAEDNKKMKTNKKRRGRSLQQKTKKEEN